MHFFLLMSTVALNVVLPYLKLLAFVFLLKISEIFLCLLLVLHIKFVPLLDVHQLQMLFAEILIYLVSSWCH
jgi:hypothetical protein